MTESNYGDHKLLYATSLKNKVNESYGKMRQTQKGYVYSERAGINSIAFCVFDQDTVGVLKHPHATIEDRVSNRSFTGSLDDPRKTLYEIVIEEVKEEAGYTVDESRVHECGFFSVGTQTNEYVHLYAVDVTELQQGELELDGFEAEEDREIVWADIESVLDNPLDEFTDDWKVALILQQWLSI